MPSPRRVFTFEMPFLPNCAYLDPSFILRVLREEATPPHGKSPRPNLNYLQRLREARSEIWTSPLGLEEVAWALVKPVLDQWGQVASRLRAALDRLDGLEVDVRVPQAALTHRKEQWLAAVSLYVVECELHPADAVHLIFAELGESDGIVSNDAAFQTAINRVDSPQLAVYAQSLAP